MVGQTLLARPKGVTGAVTPLLAAALLVPVLYLLALPSGFDGKVAANLAFIITSGLAAAACFYAARQAGAARRSWQWFGSGCTAWCAGAIAFAWQELVLGGPVPYP